MTNATNPIDAALEGRRLLDHPFYRRWEAGQLAPFELTGYAEQYRHFEAALPSILQATISQLDEGVARRALQHNLDDEVAAPSHLELFDRFAAAYGARWMPPSPAMAALLATYRAQVAAGPVQAVAGLAAYEVQGADVATSKAEGLATHYGADRSALEFWELHGTVEAHHGQSCREALDQFEATPEVVTAAAAAVASAWWGFLDEREALAAGALAG